MTLSEWLVFMAIWFMASIPIGPNAINCIVVSSKFGFFKSFYAIGGIAIASIIYMSLVFTGLGAVLMANEKLFFAVRILGALYLIWLGLKLLFFRKFEAPEESVLQEFDPAKTVRDAVLISLSNPKAMISYGAVLSQFITPGNGYMAQVEILASSVLLVIVIVYAGYGLLGNSLSWFLENPTIRQRFNRLIGSFYIGAGLFLAFSGDGRTQK